MIGTTVSLHSALRNPPRWQNFPPSGTPPWSGTQESEARQRDKVLEKLGEEPIRLDLASVAMLNPFVGLSIPPLFGGSGRRTPC